MRRDEETNMKSDKRRCVYCAKYFRTITGRLCCMSCLKLTNEEQDKIFNDRVEMLRQQIDEM